MPDCLIRLSLDDLGALLALLKYESVARSEEIQRVALRLQARIREDCLLVTCMDPVAAVEENE